MKKFAIGLAVIVVLLVGAVLVVPSFINWNQYKPEIVAAARDAAGRDLVVDGDISLSLLPAPALSVDGVRLANIEGGSAPDMVRLGALQVRVAFGPLLSGQIQVQSVRLVEPVILLEVLPDGRTNWTFGQTEAAGTSSANDGGADGAPPLSLDAFVISDGVLVYRDQAAGVEERIEGLNVEGAARSLNGPFNAAGDMTIRGLPTTFDVRVGALEPARPVSVSATLGLADTSATANVNGTLTEPTADGRFSGNLKLSADSAAELAKLATSAGGGPSQMLAQPLSLTGRVDASVAGVALNDILLRLGDLQGGGAVSATFGPEPAFDAALSVNRIDLDTLLAVNGGDGDAGTGAAAPAEDDAQAPAYPTIPANLRGSLSLAVDGVAFNGGVIRQFQANAAVADGRLTLSRLSALLPGSSDVSVSGALTTAGGAPQFDGKLETASSNLRGLANWLRLDLSRVSADRLGSLTFTGNIRATPDLLQLYGVNLRLDATTVTGGLAYRIQDRPSFGLELSVDRFNLDGYLVSAPPEKATAEPAATATNATESAAPLAALDSFDTNFKLNIGQLTYNKTRIQGVDVDMRLIGGVLTVNSATVKNLAGASLGMSATGANFSDKAAFKANLSMASNDLSGLARLTQIELPVPAQRLGRADLTARLDGNVDELKFDVKSNLAGGAVTLVGGLSQLMTTPAFDLTLDASHASLAGLSQTLDLGVVPAQGADGKVTVGGTVRGDLDAVNVNLLASAAGADLQAGGRITQLAETPTLALTVNAGHKDLVAFLNGLGIRYDPALTNLGGFGLSASLNGTPANVQVPDLKAFAGPAVLEGTLAWRSDGPRPFVEANLNANEIIVDLFLPPDRPVAATRGAAPAGQGGGAVAAGNQRWSQEPIDLAALGMVDADIDLAARGLVFRQYPFVEPRLKLALKDGRLDISQLTGQLFRGTVDLTARLDSRPGPALALDVRLDGADIQEAMRTAVGLDQVTGTLAFDGSFSTAGTSQWDLVNALNGQATVNAVNGVVRGIDMRRLSDRLAKLNEVPDYLDLIAGSFSGGETAYSAMTGTWQIENGVASTRDTQADLEAAKATLNGRAMLPAWQMDMLAELRLTEHPKAPPVGVRLFGPLDQPQRDLKTQPLEGYLAQRVGQEVLRKAIGKDAPPALQQLLGGGSRQRQQAPQQQPDQQGQPQQQQPTPDQLLDGLLRGLLKQ